VAVHLTTKDTKDTKSTKESENDAFDAIFQSHEIEVDQSSNFDLSLFLH